MWDYATNQVVPQRATVGIGNVWLDTAARPWRKLACDLNDKCIEVETELSVLQRGMHIPVSNPYGRQEDIFCDAYGGCQVLIYEPKSQVEGDQVLARQLLQKNYNIEYVAANLDIAAQRARRLNLEPSAFNSATWHLRSLQTDVEIERSGWRPGPPGGAGLIVEDVAHALRVLDLTSRWNISMEPQYDYWKALGGGPR